MKTTTLLSGYKTYITGTLAILAAVGGFASGDVALADAIQLCVAAILGMTLRNGITKENK